jgi:phasin family protein
VGVVRAKPQELIMATTNQAAKSAVEQFTTAGNKAFKDSFEKSMTALTELNTHSKKNFEAAVASVTAATKGAEALGAHAAAFSKKSVEDHVAAAKTIAAAKSVQEVVELQTAFAKSAFEAYVAEMNKMAETVAASVKESVSPINERVTAFVERMQASR